MQITYGRDDEEDRLKAELRTWNSERKISGVYSLVKELLAGPQRLVRDGLRGNAEGWMLKHPASHVQPRTKNSSPSTLREFVAFFCTKRRDKRKGLVGEVRDWQGVTDFEESVENCFGRMLLSGSVAARREGFDVLPAAMLAPPEGQKRD